MSHRPQAKRRLIELSLKTKIDLLWAAESVPKLNQKQLAEKFGIDTSTVFDIFKKKEEYKYHYYKSKHSYVNKLKLIFYVNKFIVVAFRGNLYSTEIWLKYIQWEYYYYFFKNIFNWSLKVSLP